MIAEKQTAAEFLALAALDLFPGVQLLSGMGTETLFFYDFLLKEPLKKEQVSFLEERIRFLLKKKIRVSMVEMVRSNAASLLKASRQLYLAGQVEGKDSSLVSMVQIGSYLSLCDFPCASDISDKKIKLLQSYSFKDQGIVVTRIVGCFVGDKVSVGSHHLVLNEKEGWFFPLKRGWGWAPAGELIRRKWALEWEKAAASRGFEFVTAPCQENDPAYLKAHLPCLEEEKRVCQIVESYGEGEGEGLLGTGIYHTDFFHSLPLEKNLHAECVSCLQFILEIPRILGFECEIVLYTGGQKVSKERFETLKKVLQESGLRYSVEKNPKFGQDACIVLYIRDNLGRKWNVSWMKLVLAKRGDQERKVVVEGSALGRIERLIALSLERS